MRSETSLAEVMGRSLGLGSILGGIKQKREPSRLFLAPESKSERLVRIRQKDIARARLAQERSERDRAAFQERASRAAEIYCERFPKRKDQPLSIMDGPGSVMIVKPDGFHAERIAI